MISSIEHIAWCSAWPPGAVRSEARTAPCRHGLVLKAAKAPSLLFYGPHDVSFCAFSWHVDIVDHVAHATGMTASDSWVPSFRLSRAPCSDPWDEASEAKQGSEKGLSPCDMRRHDMTYSILTYLFLDVSGLSEVLHRQNIGIHRSRCNKFTLLTSSRV